jgi:hypothetical protein
VLVLDACHMDHDTKKAPGELASSFVLCSFFYKLVEIILMSKEHPSEQVLPDAHSEQYKKYLLEVIYKGASWYTVWGTDLTDEDTDYLLTDTQGKLLLFSNCADVFRTILHTDHFPDIKTLHAWARESHLVENPYTILDLDVLSMRGIAASQIDLLETVYATIGMVGDYAVQVNNRALTDLLHSDVIRLYNDLFADYFLWSPSTPFEFVTLPDAFSDAVNDMYRILATCIRPDSL